MKLLLACTSGGHFSTMMGLRSFWENHERVWVTHEHGDTTSLLNMGEVVHWIPYQAPRDLTRLVLNIPKTVQLVLQHSPDIVISTGASIAINFGYTAKILGKKFIYVESVSRAHQLSITGRLVYPVSNEFYVQWEGLTKQYEHAQFNGYTG
ncbi:PssD/Cps14F family polysaccharide biosynthesis glycosyltransferase [Nodosilinea sp. E11]|uniref:PssD/Cps14F family polysaccharide biosynthesis glycosyltransferase n=1 Tax=Nodosilinea sp. E11 TaxID=3037479 RepID=UPI0029345E56|nr:PssD/Cps14F family polysaccharide biosynthesis glycosyltransferase [Nodosilinea sp. E11]WOD37418.1 PssD/Cps14F family polysaccharide biosynthesis glycosyltransferase [Nodosilinea sp. E11]